MKPDYNSQCGRTGNAIYMFHDRLTLLIKRGGEGRRALNDTNTGKANNEPNLNKRCHP